MRLFPILALTAAALHSSDTLQIFDRQWTVPAAADWKIEQDAGAQVLHLVEPRGPLPGPRRPIQFALTAVPNYTRLTIEADLKPDRRSLMIVFAYRDAAHFDYAHLSTDTGAKQPVHNGIFHVYGGERVRISSELGPAAFPAPGRLVHVKLTHDSMTGAVDVTVDGHGMQSLKAVDLSLGPGQIGFGSFDEVGSFRNVKIHLE